ncbi:unnamed protein product, partial [Ectocarpus sp. 13 AM-2016]
MSRRLFVTCGIASALKGLVMSGGVKEIVSFRPWIDTSLVGGILSNLILLVVFAELYWQLDQGDDHTHFGFSSAIDAYYILQRGDVFLGRIRRFAAENSEGKVAYYRTYFGYVLRVAS